MGWVFAALIVVVIGGTLIAARDRLGGMAPPLDDRPVPHLPTDRPLAAADLTSVRLAVVMRGYSPAQVDALLDRIADQLAAEPSREPAAASPGDSPDSAPARRAAPASGLGWPG